MNASILACRFSSSGLLQDAVRRLERGEPRVPSEDAEKRARVRNWRRWVFIALVLWIVAVTWWALKPISAAVHTGFGPNKLETTATVECDSPLSANTSPTQPLPSLASGQAFGASPCSLPVNNARGIYVIDVVAALGVAFFVIATRRRWSPPGSTTQANGQVPTLA